MGRGFCVWVKGRGFYVWEKGRGFCVWEKGRCFCVWAVKGYSFKLNVVKTGPLGTLRTSGITDYKEVEIKNEGWFGSV